MSGKYFEDCRAVILAMVAICLVLSTPAFAQGRDDAITYRVKRGDTLIELSKDYLRSANSWRAVQQVNRLRNPHSIRIGQTIAIPRSLLRSRPARLEVASFSGPVTIATPDGARAAAVGLSVPEGSELQTGANGFLSLAGDRGSLVSLPSQSHVRVVRARQYLLNNLLEVDLQLLRGRGELRPPKLRDNESYRAGSPYAVAAVRGTVFRIFVDGDSPRSGTEVVEGTVALSSAGTAAELPEGFGQIASPQGLGEREELLPPPQLLDRGRIQTANMLEFTLAELAGARGYRAQVARDEDFVDILDESVSDSSVIRLGGLPNGAYFVRFRGIAESGLEGLSEGYGFRRQQLGFKSVIDESPRVRGFRFSWESEGDGDIVYDFTLWPEGRENEPVLSETGMSASFVTLPQLAPGVYHWRVTAVQAGPDGALRVDSPVMRVVVVG